LKSSGRMAVRFEGLEFLDDSDRAVSGPTTGKPCTIRVHFGGEDTVPKPSRMGIGFATVAGTDLFLCANETALSDPLTIRASSIVECTIPQFPLTAGTYAMTLFLERNGIVEHWLQEPCLVTVEDGPFFGTRKNAPQGHDGKHVLVRNSWRTRELV
jgi:hypothetical protein